LYRNVAHNKFTKSDPSQIKPRVSLGSWYILIERAGSDIPPPIAVRGSEVNFKS
jgi:hypothetical protein